MLIGSNLHDCCVLRTVHKNLLGGLDTKRGPLYHKFSSEN